MNAPVKCPKCGDEMEEGFVVDHGYGQNYVAQWVAGKPEFGVFGGTKVWGKQQRPIRTFCCAKCGYLESYAPTA
jgi:predicted nucleic-acid-binding Zn-ribbon protein